MLHFLNDWPWIGKVGEQIVKEGEELLQLVNSETLTSDGWGNLDQTHSIAFSRNTPKGPLFMDAEGTTGATTTEGSVGRHVPCKVGGATLATLCSRVRIYLFQNPDIFLSF